MKSCVLTVSTAALLAVAPFSYGQTRTWIGNGNDGLWSNPANWSDNDVPNTDSEDAVINLGVNVEVDGFFGIGGLTLGSGDTLTNLNGAELQVTTGIVNDGVFTLGGSDSTTELRIFGDVTLDGAGELVLGPEGANANVNVVGDAFVRGSVLTIGSDQTIRAEAIGSIGRNTTGIVNNGAIIAEAGTLVIDPSADGYVQSSSGVLRAEDGARISLTAGDFQDVNATTTGGGVVALAGGTTVGGTFAGTLITEGFNSTSGLVNNGDLTVTNGSELEVTGDLTNNGILTLSGSNSTTELRIFGDVTLDGAGELVLGPEGANANVNVVGDAFVRGSVLTIGSDQTIRAEAIGSIGRNTTGIVNNGAIIAEAGTLVIDPSADGYVQSSSGVLRAEDGARISLTAGDFQDVNATTTGGGVVALAGGTTVGGTFAGTLITEGFNSTSGLVNNGDLTVTNGSDLEVTGDLTNNGILTLSGSNSTTELRIFGDVTLDGAGELVLGPEGANANVNVVGDAFVRGSVLTIGSDQTIRAEAIGSIGRNTTGIVNNGAIIAEAGTLVIDPSADGYVQSSSGVLRAEDGARISLTAGNFQDVNATTTGSGVVALASGTTVGGTFAGSAITEGFNSTTGLVNNGELTVTNASDLEVTGDVTNNGILTLNGDDSTTELRIFGEVTLGGTGELVLGPDGANINVNVVGDAFVRDSVLTIGDDQTIRAQAIGSIGRNTTGIVNNGTIIAEAGPLTINVAGNGPFTNDGTLTVANGATLNVVGDLIGTDTAVLSGNGRLFTGGTITHDGQISAGAPFGVLTLDAEIVTLGSNASVLTEIGGLTAGTEFDVIDVTGALSLGGDLQVLVADLFEPVSADTFEIITAATVSGTFDNADDGATLATTDNAFTFTVNYNPGSVVLSNFEVVPEPTTLVVAGLGGLALLRRRRRA